MQNNTTIGEVMTAFPHSIGHDQTLALARDMMHKYGVRHLPVQRGGQLVGILTHRDLHLAVAIDKVSEERLKTEDVCTPEPYIVEPSTALAQVLGKMAAEKLGCALVMERGKLVGIYTTVDACRDFAKALSA